MAKAKRTGQTYEQYAIGLARKLPRPTRDAIAARIRDGLQRKATAQEIAAEIRGLYGEALEEADDAE